MESNEITNELNREVFNTIQITSQENMIIKSMDKFYTYNNNVHLFLSIVNSNANISIRLIDYFVTKYSKIYKVSYKYNEETINIYSSYKQQLKAFQKKHFDPFSRGDRIPYFMGEICIITTIGQLNFFRWFISKNILDYIIQHQTEIENDMNYKNKHNKVTIKCIPNKNIEYRKKYTSATISKTLPYSTTKCYSQPTRIIVSFN